MRRLLPFFVAVAWLTACTGSEPASEAPQVFDLPGGGTIQQAEIDRFPNLVYEGRRLGEEGDIVGCTARLEEALRIRPGNEESHLELAACLAQGGQRDRALESLASAVERGYWYPQELGEDERLASLRGDPRFEAAIAAAERHLADLKAADPLAGASDPGGPFESLEALAAHFDQSADVGPLGVVLGETTMREIAWRNRRSRIRALHEFARLHPEQAAEADLEALDQMTLFSNPGPWLDAQCALFLDRHGEGPYSGAALLLQAASRFEKEDLRDSDRERHSEAMATMESVAREVVARFPDGQGSRDAYLWLLRAADDRFENQEIVTYYGKLKELRGDDESFWLRHEFELIGPRLRHDGIPEFDVESIGGETLSLAALRGRVVLLDFWATWCAPCVAELPNLREIYAEHREAGFEIVGINADSSAEMDIEAFRAWLADHDLPWPQYYEGNVWMNEVQSAFGFTALPVTVLLDRDGQIAAVNLHGKALADRVAELT